MKQLLVVLVLVAVGVAALGFYRGWFTASSGDTAHGVNVSVGVDQDKIKADEAAVKEKFRGGRGTANDGAAGRTGSDPAPDRRP